LYLFNETYSDLGLFTIFFIFKGVYSYINLFL
jgi:hypothetical protein